MGRLAGSCLELGPVVRNPAVEMSSVPIPASFRRRSATGAIRDSYDRGMDATATCAPSLRDEDPAVPAPQCAELFRRSETFADEGGAVGGDAGGAEVAEEAGVGDRVDCPDVELVDATGAQRLDELAVNDLPLALHPDPVGAAAADGFDDRLGRGTPRTAALGLLKAGQPVDVDLGQLLLASSDGLGVEGDDL